MESKSFVIISDLPEMDYMTDFVALPENYGTKAYFEREDIKAIRESVFKNLNDLNEKTHFTDDVKAKDKILVKPNLVNVFHKYGLKDVSYPETTDPRFFEAVIAYLKQYNDNIWIVESSGKGVPTMLSFRVAGYDKIADYYNTGLIPLETEPVDRYVIPKAEVQREVHLPKILSEVVNGTAYYVSVPKMKTNTYTEATLGFKNAMGTLPYNLRERNHTYDINKKLTDLLYLFKPSLVVIDGIIGGEGNTPAPVDPVKVGVVISGNNSVETDRVATRMMGINAEKNLLLMEADKRGFNDPNVTVIGTQKIVPFRPATQSMMFDPLITENFKNLDFLVGFDNKATAYNHPKKHAPTINSLKDVTVDVVKEMEAVCAGGCLATIKFQFASYLYGVDVDYDAFNFVGLYGNGVNIDGTIYFFDKNAKAYTLDEIKALGKPVVGYGECTKIAEGICDSLGEGCCNVPNIIGAHSQIEGIPGSPAQNPRNEILPLIVNDVLKMNLRKSKMIDAGIVFDIIPDYQDKVFEIPNLDEEQSKMDFVPWDVAPLTEEAKAILKKDFPTPV